VGESRAVGDGENGSTGESRFNAEEEKKKMRNKPAMLLVAVIVMLGSATDAWSQSAWRWSGVGALRTPTRTPTPTPTPTPISALPLSSDAFQLRYASNLNIGDSVVNISNAGTQGGNICANVYVFDPEEEMVACCSCVVTPNALVSLSARNDLISNTLTPAVPNSIIIKLLATAGPCNPSNPSAASLASGMRAWGTTLHALPTAGTYALTETEFSPAVLSASELAELTGECGNIQTNGSGFGICRSCRLGGQ
jgi:hypothetical protein